MCGTEGFLVWNWRVCGTEGFPVLNVVLFDVEPRGFGVEQMDFREFNFVNERGYFLVLWNKITLFMKGFNISIDSRWDVCFIVNFELLLALDWAWVCCRGVAQVEQLFIDQNVKNIYSPRANFTPHSYFQKEKNHNNGLYQTLSSRFCIFIQKIQTHSC